MGETVPSTVAAEAAGVSTENQIDTPDKLQEQRPQWEKDLKQLRRAGKKASRGGLLKFLPRKQDEGTVEFQGEPNQQESGSISWEKGGSVRLSYNSPEGFVTIRLQGPEEVQTVLESKSSTSGSPADYFNGTFTANVGLVRKEEMGEPQHHQPGSIEITYQTVAKRNDQGFPTEMVTTHVEITRDGILNPPLRDLISNHAASPSSPDSAGTWGNTSPDRIQKMTGAINLAIQKATTLPKSAPQA